MNVDKILEKHILEIKNNISKEIIARGRSASGKTSKSMYIDIRDGRGILFGSNSFYALERGRKGGNVPLNFIGIIRQWIIDKGISVKPIESKRKSDISPSERGLNSLSGAIAYSIMKKGTVLYKEKKFDDIYSSVIEKELKIMSDELGNLVSESVKIINENNQ